MKARHKRLGFVVIGLVALVAITALVLNALKGNLSYFFSPTEVSEGKAPSDHVFRLGGLVEPGSVQRNDLTVNFVVTDNAKTVFYFPYKTSFSDDRFTVALAVEDPEVVKWEFRKKFSRLWDEAEEKERSRTLITRREVAARCP